MDVSIPNPPEPPSPPIPPVSAPLNGKLNTVGILMLVNGIVNILFGLGFGGAMLLSFVLLCCAPIGLLPIVLGIFEIIYGSKLVSSSRQPVSYNTLLILSILEIVMVLGGNILSVIIGIVNLILVNDPEVRKDCI